MEDIAGRLQCTLLIPGIGDMIYAVGPDGSSQLQELIYDQGLIPKIEALLDDNDTARLHVIAASLGVTIAYNFLLGVFGEEGHAVTASQQLAVPVTARKDDAAAADQAATAKIAVSVSSGWDGGLIQTTSG
jgi:hypothetical protein